MATAAFFATTGTEGVSAAHFPAYPVNSIDSFGGSFRLK
jgi:hypothetical protein